MLPLFYKHESPPREREVAMYIDGQYITRGPARTGRQSALWGWNAGWGNVVAPERLTWELDRYPARDGHDVTYLCWGGERLTSEAYLAWLKATA